MPDQKQHAGKKNGAGKTAPPDEVPLPSLGEVVLFPEDAPPKPPADKRIHPRRPMPLVPAAPAADTDDD